MKDADIYLFDEPSSFNDIYQRLAVSRLIRSIAAKGKYVVLVEHDITFLDYASDYVQIIYGEPGAYGVVSSLYPSRTGINSLLEGMLPQENIRFRDRAVTFETVHVDGEPAVGRRWSRATPTSRRRSRGSGSRPRAES